MITASRRLVIAIITSYLSIVGVQIMHCKIIMGNVLLELGVIVATIMLGGSWVKFSRQLYLLSIIKTSDDCFKTRNEV